MPCDLLGLAVGVTAIAALCLGLYVLALFYRRASGQKPRGWNRRRPA